MTAADSNTNTLYRFLISGTAPLAATIQRAACEQGLRSKDQELLSMLLQRPDLDDDVDSRLSTCLLPSVRAAWLTRRGRDRSVVLAAVRSERRAKVIAAVAADLHSESTLLDLFVEDSRRSVLEALLAHPNTPDQGVINSVVKLGERPWSYHNAEMVSARVDARPDLHADMAAVCGRNVAHMILRTGTELPVPSLRRLSRLLVVDPLRQASEKAAVNVRQYKPTRWGNGQEPLGVVLVALDSIERLAAQPRFKLAMLADTAERWDTFSALLNAGQVQVPTLKDRVARVLQALVGDEEAQLEFDPQRRKASRLLAASTTEDHELEQFVSASINERQTIGMIDILERNPNLRLSHLRSVSANPLDRPLRGPNQENAVFRLFISALRNAEAGGDLKDPAEARSYGLYGGALCARTYQGELVKRLRLCLSHTSELRAGLLEGAVNVSWRNTSQLVELLGEQDLTEEIIGLLRSPSIELLLRTNPEVGTMIAIRLEASLGTDPLVWETFATLSESSELPLLQVATMANHLHAN